MTLRVLATFGWMLLGVTLGGIAGVAGAVWVIGWMG